MNKIIFTLFILISRTAFSGTVAGTGGSTEITQILNSGELVKQTYELERQALTIRQQLGRQQAMVDDMSLQGKNLSKQEWGNTSSDLSELSKIVRQGEAMAYSTSNVDAAYRQKFKGYDFYSRERGTSTSTYSDRYSDWSKTNMDSISSSMKAANLQSIQFQSEDEAMRSIEKLSKTSTGRNQAIQVGNMIAAQEVGQLQKLRSLIMSQMQMHAAFMSTQSSEKDLAKAKSQQFLDEDISHVRIDDGQKF